MPTNGYMQQYQNTFAILQSNLLNELLTQVLGINLLQTKYANK